MNHGTRQLAGWRKYFAAERAMDYPNAVILDCCVEPRRQYLFGGQKDHRCKFTAKRIAYVLHIDSSDRGSLYYYCILPEERVLTAGNGRTSICLSASTDKKLSPEFFQGLSIEPPVH